MGSTNESKEKEKLPIPPDINQIFNRISMGMSHHNLLSSTLKKKKPADASASSSSGLSNNTNNTKKGFSSLASNSTKIPTEKPAGNNSNPGSKSKKPKNEVRAVTRVADLDAEFDKFSGPPNAGVGFVPESKNSLPGTQGSEMDRKLRAQMLGKGRGRGREDGLANGKKKRDVNESESEDEMGRSALGRMKKKARAVTVAVPSKSKQADATQTRDVNMEDVENQTGEEVQGQKSLVGGEEITTTAKKISPASVTEPTGEAGHETGKGEEEADEQDKKKRKKKKNNKKRNKKKKDKQRATGGEGIPNGDEQHQENGQDQDQDEDEEE